MSCEVTHLRHIAHLITAANLPTTVTPDSVYAVGVGRRWRNRSTDESSAHRADPKVLAALGINGHGAETPLWVSAFLDLVTSDIAQGNRSAELTYLLLTGKTAEIRRTATTEDSTWGEAIRAWCGDRLPAWLDQIIPRRPSLATIRHLLPPHAHSVNALRAVLDALERIDHDPGCPHLPDTVSTRQQILRLFLGAPFPDRQSLAAICHAVVTNHPAVRAILAAIPQLTRHRPVYQQRMAALLGAADRSPTVSPRHAAYLALLDPIAARLQQAYPVGIVRGDDILSPSDEQLHHSIDAIMRRLSPGRKPLPRDAVADLVTLIHVWHTIGRGDAAERLSQRIPWNNLVRFHRWDVYALLSGGVMPDDSHAESVGMAIGTGRPGWETEIVTAGFSAACQQRGMTGYRTVENDDLRALWMSHSRYHRAEPMAVPLLAVGHEDVLTDIVSQARGHPVMEATIGLDIIDACDALTFVGGDSSGLRRVLAAMISQNVRSDQYSWILPRLSASPDGQRILTEREWGTCAPLPWNRIPEPIRQRIGGFLASPWWTSASPDMQEWRSVTLTDLSQRNDQIHWAELPPLPTTDPRCAVAMPHPDIVLGAVANPAWTDLPVEQRRACIRTAIHRSTYSAQESPNEYPWFPLYLIATAATEEGVEDVCASLDPADRWIAHGVFS